MHIITFQMMQETHLLSSHYITIFVKECNKSEVFIMMPCVLLFALHNNTGDSIICYT